MSAQSEPERTAGSSVQSWASVSFLNVLEISPRKKTVPYEGETRRDGGTDHGFKNLKLHPELLDTVPELELDPALRKILAAIDRPATGLFSIACESRVIADARGSRLSGYLEFALNCRDDAGDAARYFRIFYDFDRRLRRQCFQDAVSFQWVICPTRFVEAQLDGFAAEVRVDTAYQTDPASAYESWRRALAALEATLIAVPHGAGLPIYYASTPSTRSPPASM
jgi:hypothetical protein